MGFFRRNLLVPIPVISEVIAANREFLARSERHWDRPHYQKGQAIRTLFLVDREALRALPPQGFAPYRYTQVRTDRQGRFCLEGPHWYSSSPECAQQTITVRIGAHSVEPMAADGRLLTRHPRGYGSLRSDSNDYRTTVHQVSQKPGAWRNSALRAELSEPARAVLDAAARADLQAALKGLAQSTDRWGFDHAVRALEEAVTRGHTQCSDIIATAQRMAWAPNGVVSSAVDLDPFDVLMEGRMPG